MAAIDPNINPGNPDNANGEVPWWQLPPPAGYTGQWPPPLPPGAHYGSAPGSIEYTPSPSPVPGGWPTTNGPTNPNPADSYQPDLYRPTTTAPGPTSTTPPTTTVGGLLSGPTAPGMNNLPQDDWKPPKPTDLPTLPDFRTGAPTFTQPPAFSYGSFDPGAPFVAPSAADAENSPGYQFRIGQGRNALQNWAAARGTLNDSSTAQGLIDYGQGAASQEYNNVWNRAFQGWEGNFDQRYRTYTTNRANALDAYNTNYQTQYHDPYVFEADRYKNLVVDPGLHQYDLQGQNTIHQNDIANTNSWNNYIHRWNQYVFGQDNWLEKLRLYLGQS